MFGNRNQNQNNRQGKRRSGSTAGVCACPQCGYSIPHQAGTPCQSLLCPVCKVPLVRGESAAGITVNNAEKQIVATASVQAAPVFPVVDAELCVGCETCVEACPANAILMVDGQAQIQNELCRKCRKCVRACPVGAIS